MKKFYIALLSLLCLTCQAFAQNCFNVYQENVVLKQIPTSDVDSISVTETTPHIVTFWYEGRVIQNYDTAEIDSITISAEESTKNDRSGIINGHAYVDLGLPSGTLWATCNIGADSPEDYGLYFAWGETTGYTQDTSDGHWFDWTSYKYAIDSYDTLTKYCFDSSYGNNGFTDTLTELEPEDDAAYVNWGSEWRMPSLAQIEELLIYSFARTTWTEQNGVYGRKITSDTNGNSLFLPAAGYRGSSSLNDAGSGSYYWSRTLLTRYPYIAYDLYSVSSYFDLNYYYRFHGLSVRPVRASQN